MPASHDRSRQFRLSIGCSWPLGATPDKTGINFALFSQHATKVELCLFDAEGQHEIARLSLPEQTDQVWHGHLAGAAPGLIYGFRVHGPHVPEQGHRFDPELLLLDPYAREIVGRLDAPGSLKARVIRNDFDWGDDQPPQTPWCDTVLYEAHVRGLTRLHPGLPEALRGSYAGLVAEPVINHLKRLGVTAISLLPVHYSLDEHHLTSRNMINYWGYNTLGFFTPTPRYAATSDAITEFKTMVKSLHQAGLEVILDVVYNHTAEGGVGGPTLSFRGIDNLAYYRLRPGDPYHYENHSGCGNSLNLSHPRVLQMVMDSLRYWVQEMHVDGFRFDLATALAREYHGFDCGSGFLDAVRQDPILAGVKLIAEPWDVGHGGYQVGAFPAGWSEWNDHFRDTARGFWLHRCASRGEMARRMTASSDLFHHNGRKPQASINYITAHDGFTLRDLVSYSRKHNEDNGEHNRDGHDHNLSCNCGVEGATDDPSILDLRLRLKRSLLASLYLAQGVPQLLAGDECGRSQRGNNNAYCQNNEINWLDWAHLDRGLVEFVARLATLRRRYPMLRSRRWLDGTTDSRGIRDVSWLGPDGRDLDKWQWEDSNCHSLAFTLAEPEGNELLLVLMNAEDDRAHFRLPHGDWLLELDTAQPPSAVHGIMHSGSFAVQAKSLVLLRRRISLAHDHRHAHAGQAWPLA